LNDLAIGSCELVPGQLVMRSEVDSSQLVLNVLRLLRELLLRILEPLRSLMGEALVVDEYDVGLSID
jgi:hypothetical protein